MSTQTKPVSDSAAMKLAIEGAKKYARQNDMLKTAHFVSLLRDKFVLSPKEIQFKLAKANCHISLPHIYNHFKLNDVPDKVKEHIDAGKINSTQVLSLMHKHQVPEELIADVEVNIFMLEQANANSKVKLQQKETTKIYEEVEKVVSKTFGADLKHISNKKIEKFTDKIAKLMALTHEVA